MDKIVVEFRKPNYGGDHRSTVWYNDQFYGYVTHKQQSKIHKRLSKMIHKYCDQTKFGGGDDTIRQRTT